MIPTVLATAFVRELDSGATEPCILLCEDDDGNLADYVVKFRATVRGNACGIGCECLGVLIARHFEIPTLEPALVEFDPSLADAVQDINPEVAERIRRSPGVNFGTHLASGLTTWMATSKIRPVRQQLASEILAFDALLRNADRRRDNPNLLANDEDFFVIDHEIAFGFIYDFASEARPWAEELRYLNEHVLCDGMRGRGLLLDRFEENLESLTSDVVAKMFSCLPNGGDGVPVEKIGSHLEQSRTDRAQLVRGIKEVVR